MFKQKHHKQRILNGLTVVLGILLLLPLLSMKRHDDWMNAGHIPTDHRFYSLNPGLSINQSFQADEDRLNGIRILVRLSEQTLHGTSEVVGSTNDFVLAPNRNLIQINFEPIEDSQGNDYNVKLTGSEANKTIIPIVTALNGRDWIAQLSYDREMTFAEFFKTVGNNMSQYKPDWTKSPYLYIYILVFIGGTWGLLRKIVFTFLND